MDSSHELIVTIVPKGVASEVVQASKDAGAGGGTVLYGRGTGIHEAKKLFGMSIDPEKEIILTVVTAEQREKITQAIVERGKLNKAGNGLTFSVPLSSLAGIVHLTGGDSGGGAGGGGSAGGADSSGGDSGGGAGETTGDAGSSPGQGDATGSSGEPHGG